ncbi:protein FAR1-RELATED SEQUENCE 5-like [Prunus dulcis]|uniref:protein FAR1-RELATED SEQUENCE 5-like n=1 Tax=Prunus dulcis TaxID=3755 RepID=UPI001481DEBA|nr:protein FAR1-RELATED SEQUENCE 5-like [Prunus dulcis]
MECEGQVTPEVSGIRHSVFYNENGHIDRRGNKEYVCCKQGYSLTSTVSRKRRRRGCTRTGCKAKLAILKVKENNKYIVIGFNEVSLLVVQVERLENVGFVKRDVYNYLRDVRGEVIRHDAELLKEHFLAKQEKNESFYFKMEVDLEGRMGNVFWLDARSRRAYWFFGDVVVFDTMFNTNPYGMVFVPLLGFNNHRQTVLFGCAFLTSETTDSFVWLLEEFKKAMPGEPPKMIITDQDVAKSKAIAITLLTTFHRYCIWHILNKITEKPGIGECVSKMCKCIWGMDTKE